MKISLISSNLRYDNKNDGRFNWKYRRGLLIDFIGGNDFIGTQEGLPHMLDFIDIKLINYKRISEAREPGGEANAIYYCDDKWELKFGDSFFLSETPKIRGSKSWDSALPRICSWACFINKINSQTIYVFNTHLDHVGKLARYNGLQIIFRELNCIVKNYDTPIFLLGDFNANYSENTLNLPKENNFKSVIELCDRNSNQVNDYTYFGFDEDEKKELIDYIFYRGAVNLNSAKILKFSKNFPLSDHFPVWCEVEI